MDGSCSDINSNQLTAVESMVPGTGSWQSLSRAQNEKSVYILKEMPTFKETEKAINERLALGDNCAMIRVN
jgi:hypothetical protein